MLQLSSLLSDTLMHNAMHLSDVQRRELVGPLARVAEADRDASIGDIVLGDLPHRLARQRAIPQARAAECAAFDNADALLVVQRTHRRRIAGRTCANHAHVKWLC
jgi:hypothetical protein